MAWSVGDLWPPTAQVDDPATGTLVDPGAIVFTITKPDKSTSTPTPERLEAGVYRVKVSLTESGEWLCKVKTTGAYQASRPVFKINVLA
jgi:hypothetical protein